MTHHPTKLPELLFAFTILAIFMLAIITICLAATGAWPIWLLAIAIPVTATIAFIWAVSV